MSGNTRVRSVTLTPTSNIPACSGARTRASHSAARFRGWEYFSRTGAFRPIEVIIVGLEGEPEAQRTFETPDVPRALTIFNIELQPQAPALITPGTMAVLDAGTTG